MPFIDTILFVTIVSLFPFLIYLFYIAYNQNINREEKGIILSLTYYTAFYLILKTEAIFVSEHLILAIVPIIIAYSRKRHQEAIVMSVLLIFYFFMVENIIFEIFVICLLSGFCYLLNLKYRFSNIKFVCLTMTTTILIVIINTYVFHNHDISTPLWVIAACLISVIEVNILKFGDVILNYHENYRKLLEDNFIKSSLFKIAHEVKNPLAVTLGYLEMLDIKNTEQCQKYIPIIKEEIDHSLVILQDFSDIGKIKITKELMDVNMLIEEVSKTLKLLLSTKKIGLDLNLIDDDIYIDGDYSRLTQVIINVIKNSAEAIKENGLITIETYIEDGRVIIMIVDNGEGMSEETLSKIYEPFYTTKCNGTGLGIFLSQEIIKRHDGEIKYFSEIGKGTKVQIILPNV